LLSLENFRVGIFEYLFPLSNPLLKNLKEKIKKNKFPKSFFLKILGWLRIFGGFFPDF